MYKKPDNFPNALKPKNLKIFYRTVPANKEDKPCVKERGFCCSGFQFNIELNQTISPNETLMIFRGKQYVGNMTKLFYGCKGSQYFHK